MVKRLHYQAGILGLEMYHTSVNTGAAYMARRGWDKDPSSQGSISFHGSSRKKVMVIVALAILGLLLIAAVIIIILFAVGVISRNPIVLPSTTYPPINPGIPGPLTSPKVYRCTFVVLRQANSAYNEKSSTTFQYAFNMMTAAVTDSIQQSSLAASEPTVTMDNLTNRGEDLQVDFMLQLRNSLENSVVETVIRAQIRTIQQRLGGNVSIDPNSVRVVS